ncbi:MAG: hypothetical protein Wins2KO_13050 [Winogradskyella sp.]
MKKYKPNNLRNALIIEMHKLKSTNALKLSVISGAFIPLIFFLYYMSDYQNFNNKELLNPWIRFLSDQFQNTAPFLLPTLIILQCSLIAQIEHKINGFKFIFVQPISRVKIYISKLITVVFLLLITYIIFGISLYLFGIILGLTHEHFAFLEFKFPIKFFLNFVSATFIANLAILGMQFWLSIKYKNFILPLGLGLVLLITGLIVFRAKESFYFPYSYSLYAIYTDNPNLKWYPQIGLISLIYFLTITIIGCFQINRENIN